MPMFVRGHRGEFLLTSKMSLNLDNASPEDISLIMIGIMVVSEHLAHKCRNLSRED